MEDLERVGVGEGGYHQNILYIYLKISNNVLYKNWWVYSRRMPLVSKDMEAFLDTMACMSTMAKSTVQIVNVGEHMSTFVVIKVTNFIGKLS